MSDEEFEKDFLSYIEMGKELCDSLSEEHQAIFMYIFASVLKDKINKHEAEKNTLTTDPLSEEDKQWAENILN